MAEPDLISPLLPKAGLSQPSDEPQFIVTVDDDRGSEPLPQSTHQQPPNRIHNPNHRASNTHLEMENPFGFLGVGGFDVPATATIDPFRNQTAMIEGVYECVKILICVPIAIARLLLFGLSLSVGYVATKIALQGWKDKENPMPKWRCRLMWVTRLCARCILFAFGYHWIKRRGRPAPRETAPIVVSNHVSYIEPIFFFYELFPTIVAAESHDSIPFVGTIIRAMQVIYVNRFSPSSRKHAVNEIKRKASSGRFPRLLLFPEGTTTNGRLLISFQLGAFIPGYPIQPVVVRYPHVHFDQSWGNVTLAKLMFRMFTQLHNFMEVEYLPVISPLENQKENAVHFAERTGRIIATALNVVQTSHSYGDFMLLAKASESKQENPTLYMVEMARVESTFHLSSLEAVDFLDTFLSMNPDSSGHVKVHDFCRVLRLKACRLSEKIFGLLDVEKKGKITFKQFLYGSAHVLKQPLFRQACEFAFAECHTSGNHYISEQEFGHSALQAIPNLKQFEVHELFKLFDSDGDGRISKDDFTKCLRRNPLLIALFSPQLMLKNLLGSA
ncbi:LOW QUALITY PROTEIN: lysophospholipid acyltransferase LPEAT2-like [Actinidia eriantha]|uniref:LOW QUALITY PROTEIN: lysophospholipid acyltransferase LPEAT2-like n=1 Tax=Actinidia eriantha TaxID=165200 RepID=UPI0025898567|nr:LOW QUALITY PROTEIN: lysophospholipid acyltransferase LPEAT2-like [Actinidia eriantha]